MKDDAEMAAKVHEVKVNLQVGQERHFDMHQLRLDGSEANTMSDLSEENLPTTRMREMIIFKSFIPPEAPLRLPVPPMPCPWLAPDGKLPLVPSITQTRQQRW